MAKNKEELWRKIEEVLNDAHTEADPETGEEDDYNWREKAAKKIAELPEVKACTSCDMGAISGAETRYSYFVFGSTPEELDEMILRAALDIRERRDAARRQRMVDFMRGKNAR